MNRESIDACFEEWWRESYGVPPSLQGRMTHVAFGEHLLQLMELMQPAATTPEVA